MMKDIGQIVTPELSEVNTPTDILISVAQLQPTERPIEDRYSVNFDPTQSRIIVGVYDGHGGFECADHISKLLPLRLLKHSPMSHAQQFLRLDREMLTNFKQDHSIFHSKSPNWIHHAQLMRAGCTALVLDIDLNSLMGHYANAGDCRLVVCNSDYREGQVLLQSEDLNTGTPSEQDRLSREHPNEDMILIHDRLFGRLMSTRAFGDGYFKLPKGPFGDFLHRRYIKTISAVERPGKVTMTAQYASLFYGYKTPPYVTAHPDTGPAHQFQKGDIAVMATDGLWDLVSSEDVVEIISRGLKSNTNHLAKYLLEKVKERKQPGDDVTIVVLQV